MESNKAALHWGELLAIDHYQALLEIRNALSHGDISTALFGLNEYIDDMASQEVSACQSHLTVLMLHILKWKDQPLRRSRSWLLSILNARKSIQKLRKKRPSINKSVIEDLWTETFIDAKALAALEMGLEEKKYTPTLLTWEEVFETEYPYSDLPMFND